MATVRIRSPNLFKHIKLPTYGDIKLRFDESTESIAWYRKCADVTNLDFFYQLPVWDKMLFVDNWYTTSRENEFATFKYCALDTQMYDEPYNVVSLRMSEFDNARHISVCISSIDDGSFMMWVAKPTLNDLQECTDACVKWLDSQTELSGFEMFEFGRSIGFDQFFKE